MLFRSRLGGISKRGNAYMRTLLTQGAQNVLNSACPSVRLKTLEANEPSERPAKTDDIHQFARQLRARKPRNVVVAAIANRMARMLYVLLKQGVSYRANRMPQEAPKTEPLATKATRRAGFQEPAIPAASRLRPKTAARCQLQ